MLNYEITRFTKSYDLQFEDDPSYLKKMTYNPVEVLHFLETGCLEGATVCVSVWDENNKFVSSFSFGV